MNRGSAILACMLASLLAAPGAALAGGRWSGGHLGAHRDGGKSAAWHRPGLPPWAPAHGYRRNAATRDEAAVEETSVAAVGCPADGSLEQVMATMVDGALEALAGSTFTTTGGQLTASTAEALRGAITPALAAGCAE